MSELDDIRARREAVTTPFLEGNAGRKMQGIAQPMVTTVDDQHQVLAFLMAAPDDIDTLLAEVERLTVALHDDAATKLGDAVLEASRLRREVAALTAERDALAQQLQQAQTQLAAWSVKPNAQYIAIAQQRVEQATTPEA